MSATRQETPVRPQAPASIVKQRIDNGIFSARQVLIILICFMINVVDGFDLLAMAYGAPSLSTDWGVEPGELGIIFSSGLVGMTLGALALSPLGDKFGRRTLILASVALTSLCMLLTPLTHSIDMLVLVRFLTGLGIGGVLASVVSLTSEYSPSRYSNYAVIFVQSGYAVGSVLGGVVAGAVIETGGWQSLFWFGGVITGVLFLASWCFLPESIEYLAAKQGDHSVRLREINKILQRLKKDVLKELPEIDQTRSSESGSVVAVLRDHRSETIKLWIIFFAAVWFSYFLTNWIPILFVNSGLSGQEGIEALTFYTLGGLIGAQILGLASTRINLKQLIAGTFAVTVFLLAGLALYSTDSSILLNTLVTSIGLTFAAGFTALYAIASKAYPAHLRATGIGWCVGLGRCGAILSPLIVGFMLDAGWTMAELIFVVAIPPLVAAVFFVITLRE